MIYGIYCMRDRKVGWLAPQLDRDDNCAIRTFAMTMNNAPSDSLIGFAPKDFDLYYMGKFDSEKGTFETGVPEFLVSGDMVLGDNYEKEA